MQFITSIRITNAQMLLETTNYAVNEIARIVGYDNPLYFSRLFHKQKGCSPSEYRKLLKWTNKRGSLSEWFSLESLLILSCYLRHSTSLPALTKPTPRFAVVVVLDTPPFWLHIAITLHIILPLRILYFYKLCIFFLSFGLLYKSDRFPACPNMPWNNNAHVLHLLS